MYTLRPWLRWCLLGLLGVGPLAFAQSVPLARVAPTPAAAESAVLPPLPQVWQDAFAQLVEDPKPRSLVRNTHYIVSNEDMHYVWKDHVRDRGGVYIGVGTDQNYLLAAWAKPELLVLLDFDQMVVDLHRVYGLIFLAAPTPEDFLDLWEERNVRRVEALIDSQETDAARKQGMLHAYRTSHYAVSRRLREVGKRYRPLGVPWFLTDAAQYRYLVMLFRTGRVKYVRGDLSLGGSLQSVATATKKSGGVVRTVYFSNAERYFPYTRGFTDSVLGLPTDDRSLILRTKARISGLYEYIVQDADNLRAWLQWGKLRQAFHMSKHREPDGKTGGYVLRKLPPSTVHPPDRASSQAKQPSPQPPSTDGARTPVVSHQTSDSAR